ncbi:uncharacterized protein IWZ02DRAFT_114208 [Phyllosticta citriasiana]|uniref:Uncharacterized protein n=1 Tax=Phyllosticta citriasiana TaxID=595635 RepID=A0ABR1KF35_9PEZI
MGRDAFLTRLVLGRSAYGPPERFPEGSIVVGPDTRTSQVPHERVQMYDEHGHPVNPEARALGRALRDAQNDVLAAIGVVERKRVHISTGASIPAQKDPSVVRRVEAENLSGTVIAIIGTLARYTCMWWASALQDRILTFDYDPDLPFVQLVRDQYHVPGFFTAGLPAQLMSMITNDGDLWASLAISTVDESVLHSDLSRKERLRIQRWKPLVQGILSIAVELAFSPIILHAAYQRLLLVPASQLLPTRQAFNPSTPLLRQQMSLLVYDLSVPNIIGLVRELATSPAVMIVAWRHSIMRMQRLMYESVEKGVLVPDNPDIYTIGEVSERWIYQDVNSNQWKGAQEHSWFNRLFSFLDWTWSTDSSVGSSSIQPPNNDTSSSDEAEQQATVGDSAPTSDAVDAEYRSRAESPAETAVQQQGNATVRIASRDENTGVVSIEIALPEVVEEAPQQEIDTGNQSGNEQDRDSGRALYNGNRRGQRRRHRVTQLAEEPAEMLGSWINFTLSDWVLLPAKAIGLRMMARGLLQVLSPGSRTTPRVFPCWPSRSDFTGDGLHRLGVYAGRIGLCCAIEVVLGLGLWGCECLAVTTIGRRHFQWGRSR